MKKISLMCITFMLGLFNAVYGQKGGFDSEQAAEKEDI